MTASRETVLSSVTNPLVQCMIGIEQRDSHVDVEWSAHQQASCSRNRAISALVTMPPRFGHRRNPCRAFGAFACVVSGGVFKALRASSELTSPDVRFSWRARSLAARATLLAISRVVRTHQMSSRDEGRNAASSKATGVRVNPLIR